MYLLKSHFEKHLELKALLVKYITIYHRHDLLVQSGSYCRSVLRIRMRYGRWGEEWVHCRWHQWPWWWWMWWRGEGWRHPLFRPHQPGWDDTLPCPRGPVKLECWSDHSMKQRIYTYYNICRELERKNETTAECSYSINRKCPNFRWITSLWSSEYNISPSYTIISTNNDFL